MDDQVQHFLHFMSVEKGASANTISAYRNDLQQFRGYIHESRSNGRGAAWSDVDRDLLLQYILDMRAKEYADATVARKVAAVKSFFNYLTAEGIVTADPTETLSSPRVGKTLPKALSVREVDELLEQPDKRSTPEAKRDKAMLELLYATGMRVSELVALDLDSIELHNHRATVRCLGKGNKERLIPIHGASRDRFALLPGRRPAGHDAITQGARALHQPARRAADPAGVLADPEELRQGRPDRRGGNAAHPCGTPSRPTCCRAAPPCGTSRNCWGTRTFPTTQVYTQLTDEHVRRVYDTAHPRAR